MTRPGARDTLPGMRILAPLVALAVLAGGCQNSCQRICHRMARFAEQCGEEVSREEVQACVDAQASAEDRAVCRELGSRSDIEAEWTCDDVAVYWSRTRSTGDTGAEASGTR